MDSESQKESFRMKKLKLLPRSLTPPAPSIKDEKGTSNVGRTDVMCPNVFDSPGPGFSPDLCWMGDRTRELQVVSGSGRVECGH